MTVMSLQRVSATAVATVALVFAAGVATGVAVDRRMPGRRVFKVETPGDLGRLYDRLGLSPAQRTVAESIASQSAPASAAVMRELAERLRAVSDSFDSELRGILTERQRAMLDSLRRDQVLLLKSRAGGKLTIDTVRPPASRR